MTSVSMRQMLEAGVHFDIKPASEPEDGSFIFGELNKIHIINLEKTQPPGRRRSSKWGSR